MSNQKIKGKTIDEINQMFQEASAGLEAERQKFFDEQWEQLKEEIAQQEEQQIQRAEDLEWGRMVMENDNLEKEIYV
jgi:DNA-binding transcriptional MerR regulator